MFGTEITTVVNVYFESPESGPYLNFGTMQKGQSMFGTSNFGTAVTSAPNVNFGTKFNRIVNFGTMKK